MMKNLKPCKHNVSINCAYHNELHRIQRIQCHESDLPRDTALSAKSGFKKIIRNGTEKSGMIHTNSITSL
jgi:hypothetical protein